GDHFYGIYKDIGASQPGYIGFYIRSASTTESDAYAVFRDSNGWEAIWFFARGNGFLYINENVGGNESVPYEANRWYHIEFKDIDFEAKSFDYYVDEELIQADVPFRNQPYVEDLYRLDVYNWDYGAEAWWDEIWISTEEPAGWLSADPRFGTVPPGTTMDIEVQFNAAGLYGGGYDAHLVVTSNDPVTPEVTVPAHLQVEGAPHIAVSPDTLAYGAVFIGATPTKTVVVTNEGTEVLVVSDVSSDLGDYVPDLTSFSLAPNATQHVVVTFSPTAVGNRAGMLTITSDDPDEPVRHVVLSGEGLEPPIISVAPDSLSEDLLTGGMSTQTLTIDNTGGSDLEFGITIRDLTAGAVLVRTVARKGSPDGVRGVSPFSDVTAVPEGPDLRGPQETAGERIGFTDDVPPPPPGVIFEDDFEDGDFDGWGVAGSGIKEVTSETAANGTAYSYHEYNSSGDHFNGIFKEFGATQPGYIGFYIRSSSVSQHDAYAVFRNSDGYETIWFFAEGNGFLYCNEDVGGDNSVPYVANQWYHIEFKDIDFTAKNFDYYVDEVLIQADISFRNWPGVEDLYRVDLYSWSSGAEAWWDEVWISTDEPARWLALDPRFGTVPPGTSMDLEVTFDAAGLYGGEYDANIAITSNDPLTPRLDVPAHLHVTGAPDIAISDTLFAYGALFIGASAMDTLVVSNVGTDLLTVTDLSADLADYTTDLTNFTLAPGTNQEVVVTFSPDTSGVRAGTLSISSDDPDDPLLQVALLGEGLEPPVISVAPESLNVDLMTGDVSTRQLTIDNAGGGADLIWSIAAHHTDDTTAVLVSNPAFSSTPIKDTHKDSPSAPLGRPDPEHIFKSVAPPSIALQTSIAAGEYPAQDPTSLETILDNLNTNYASVTGVIPNRYDFSGGESGYYITDGGGDMYDGGNYLSTNFGNIIYSDNVIVNSAYFGAGGRYFTRKYPGLFVLAADMNGVQYFEISGNLGADGSGSADGAILQARVSGIDFYGFVKRVYNAYDPSVNHLIIVEQNPQSNHEFATNTNDDYHRVFGLTGVTRIYDLLYAGSGGFYIDNNATLTIMETFLEALGLAPEWIRMVPMSGTIPAGGDATVDVTFDATGLFGGEYHANLSVTSNDPVTPEVVVPSHLSVTGAANIEVSHTEVDFGSLFVGNSVTRQISVHNVGTDDLVVGDITSSNPDFSADPVSFTVPYGGHRTVFLTFAPTVVGAVADTLTILSNDPDEPEVAIAVVGEGIEPPQAVVSPDSLAEALYSGETSMHPLSLANTGGSALMFSISTSTAAEADSASSNPLVTWLSINPVIGAVEPDSVAVIDVMFDATGLPGGLYETNIVISTNDPGEPQVVIPVDLDVTGAPAIVVSDTLLNFGQVYIGYDDTRSLVVENPGTDVLMVSDLATDDAEFEVAPTSFDLPPGGAELVVVTFTPTVAGPAAATLSITSNDPNNGIVEVDLIAQAAEPPIISASPDSIVLTLSPGETFLDTIDLANIGGSDLMWGVEIRGIVDWGPGLSLVTTSATQGPDVKKDSQNAPSKSEVPGPLSSFRILWHGDHGPGGIGLWSTIIGDLTSQGATIVESSDPITATMLADIDALWLGDRDVSFTIDEMLAVEAWLDAGGNLLIEADSHGSYVVYNDLLSTLNAGLLIYGSPGYAGTTPNIHPHEMTLGVSTIFLPGPGKTLMLTEPHAAPLIDDLFTRRVVAYSIVGSGKVVVMSDQVFHDLAINLADNRLFANRVFAWFGIWTWLSVSPESGTLAPATNTDLGVTIDASSLGSGSYRQNIEIRSNDPATPVVTIPVALTVDSLGSVTGIYDDGVPTRYALHSNYPNPFNPTTTIAYELPQRSDVRLLVYDVKGRQICELVNDTQPFGRHEVAWNGRDESGNPVASGVYFYKLVAGDFVQTRKMVLLK
ncbi:MAG: choice-of-anchor D domain-containing protein, partial [Candidatus Latescibacterota bacterium]